MDMSRIGDTSRHFVLYIFINQTFRETSSRILLYQGL
jgi:hypothetical protein